MIFRRCCINGVFYGNESGDALKGLVFNFAAMELFLVLCHMYLLHCKLFSIHHVIVLNQKGVLGDIVKSILLLDMFLS